MLDLLVFRLPPYLVRGAKGPAPPVWAVVLELQTANARCVPTVLFDCARASWPLSVAMLSEKIVGSPVAATSTKKWGYSFVRAVTTRYCMNARLNARL